MRDKVDVCRSVKTSAINRTILSFENRNGSDEISYCNTNKEITIHRQHNYFFAKWL